MIKRNLERRRLVGPRRRAFLCLAAAWWFHGGCALSWADGRDYDVILDLAREGNYDVALPYLRAQMQDAPGNARYRNDYITVLGWAGRDQDVLAQVNGEALVDYPPYVLESVAKAARNRQRYDLALGAYAAALYQQPRRLPSRVGVALVLIDQGLLDEAQVELGDLRQSHGPQVDILEAQAYLYAKRRAYFDQLTTVSEILRLQPDHKKACRDRTWLIHRLGAPHLALAEAQRNPSLFSAEEMAAFRAHAAALRIRWGRLADAPATGALDDTRRAIELLEEQIAMLKRDREGSRPLLQQAYFDLMTALRDDGQTLPVIRIHQRLRQRDVHWPAYALVAAADAYLAEEQPEVAQRLYEQALARDPGNFVAGISLFYAYVEGEDFPRALRLIDHLSAEQPAWLPVPGTPRRKPNWRRLQADTIAALGRAYSDRLGEAQERLEAMVARAPNNADLRNNQGTVYLWRGWPRRAREQFRMTLAAHPANRSARVGLHEANKTLNRFAEADRLLDALDEDFPGSGEVTRLQHNWRIHNMRTLRIDAGGSKSSGPQLGTSDFRTDTYLYSQPLAYHYRPYIHYHFASASFQEGSPQYQRTGFGVELRAPGMEAQAELHRAEFEETSSGVALATTWRPLDRWSVSAGFDSESNDVPLRGRPQGLHGEAVNLDLGYHFNESASVGAGFKRSEFSDGNLRESASLSLFRRLITGPEYKLNARAGFYASRNSLSGRPYYNPSSDWSSEISLTNEWLAYRRYSRSMHQQFGATLGQYYQSGVGLEPYWALQYEHQWRLFERFGLTYGISPALMVYDGVHESSLRAYMHLSLRF